MYNYVFQLADTFQIVFDQLGLIVKLALIIQMLQATAATTLENFTYRLTPAAWGLEDIYELAEAKILYLYAFVG